MKGLAPHLFGVGLFVGHEPSLLPLGKGSFFWKSAGVLGGLLLVDIMCKG